MINESIHHLGLFYAAQHGVEMDKKSPEARQYLTSLLSTLEDVIFRRPPFLIYKYFNQKSCNLIAL